MKRTLFISIYFFSKCFNIFALETLFLQIIAWTWAFWCRVFTNCSWARLLSFWTSLFTWLFTPVSFYWLESVSIIYYRHFLTFTSSCWLFYFRIRTLYKYSHYSKYAFELISNIKAYIHCFIICCLTCGLRKLLCQFFLELFHGHARKLLFSVAQVQHHLLPP